MANPLLTGEVSRGGGGGFGSNLYAAALLRQLMGGGNRAGGFAAWQQRRMAEHSHKLGQEAADNDLNRQKDLLTHQTNQTVRERNMSRKNVLAMHDQLQRRGFSATDLHSDGTQWQLSGLSKNPSAAPAPFNLADDLGVNAKNVTDIDLASGAKAARANWQSSTAQASATQ
jgi:hypothetical protein